MTNGKCACTWNDNGEVTGFCGAHQEHHRKLTEPLIVDRARLEQIKVYAKTQHPLISSQACPLCEWSWKMDEKTGFGVGTRGKDCSYHHALHQLYTLKIEDSNEN